MKYSFYKGSLKRFNTFNLNVKANNVFIIRNINILYRLWHESNDKEIPVTFLGEGSNVLFLDDFTGQVFINRIRFINIRENNRYWFINVGSGELWRRLVKYCTFRGITGLENLAKIPGCVGSAAIQNIGAYGVEFSNFCNRVSMIHLPTNKIIHVDAKDCAFSYRNSIFMNLYKYEYFVISVEIKLSKIWKPVLTHKDLRKINIRTITPAQIFNIVSRIRKYKLPNPNLKGNAGSFFKNPIISLDKIKELANCYSEIPYSYKCKDRARISASWLIDKCHLKGFKIGGAKIYTKQAAIIVNDDNASSRDIISLAKVIRRKVGKKFNIWLEPEVRFLGSRGEIDAIDKIS